MGQLPFAKAVVFLRADVLFVADAVVCLPWEQYYGCGGKVRDYKAKCDPKCSFWVFDNTLPSGIYILGESSITWNVQLQWKVYGARLIKFYRANTFVIGLPTSAVDPALCMLQNPSGTSIPFALTVSRFSFLAMNFRHVKCPFRFCF